jgi:hypothetical protein
MSESAFPFDVLGPIHGYRIWRVLEHGLMTYSPMEIHPWSFDRFTAGMVAVTTSGYNPLYILSGLVMGPLFGLLGQRWCLRRSWVSAALVAGALCLEPLARWAAGQLRGPALVWTAEVALGVVVAALFTFTLMLRGPWSLGNVHAPPRVRLRDAAGRFPISEVTRQCAYFELPVQAAKIGRAAPLPGPRRTARHSPQM